MKTFINILSIALSATFFSCGSPGTEPKASSKEKIQIAHEGVNIAYDDMGTGDTTLLFIHGWGINKTYWSNQDSFFSKSYRVVAVDLPGFGTSGKNRKSWSVEDYGKDLTAVLTSLDLKNVVLIGHSMSGAIALETALTNPTRVIGVVGIDNFKNFGYIETDASKKETANIYKAVRANFKATITEYVSQALFAPSTDSAIKKRVLDDILSSDTIIAVNCMEQGDQYPLNAKLSALKLPLNLINSSLTPTDTAAFKKGNIKYNLYDIGAVGHYPMLEKPQAFNDLLQRAIDGM